MTRFIFVFLVALFIASSATAEQPKVYSDEDLSKYKSKEKSNSDEIYRQKSSANENATNEYNLEERKRKKVDQEEQLKEDYCRRGDALRSKIALYKSDVAGTRWVTRMSVSDIGYDANLSRFNEAITRLESAQRELRSLEDELHRKGLPVG